MMQIDYLGKDIKIDFIGEDLKDYQKERNLSKKKLIALFQMDHHFNRNVDRALYNPFKPIELILQKQFDKNTEFSKSVQATKVMLTRNVNGQYLYDLRMHLGITQKEMAASIGYSTEQFSHAEEKREKTLSRKMRNKLVDIYPDQIISDVWNTQLSDYDHLGINNFFADNYSQFPEEIDLIRKSLRNLLYIDDIKDNEMLLDKYMKFLSDSLLTLNDSKKTLLMGNHK